MALESPCALGKSIITSWLYCKRRKKRIGKNEFHGSGLESRSWGTSWKVLFHLILFIVSSYHNIRKGC